MRALVPLLISATLLATTPWAAQGASLGLRASESGEETGQVAIPVYLDASDGEPVASLQCDLRFETATLRFLRVEAGEAATHAEKLTHANLIRPDCVRLIVAGFNRTTIEAGPVAWIHFAMTGPLPETTLQLETAVLSDPHGNAVPVVLSPNTLELGISEGVVQSRSASGSAIPKAKTNASANYLGLVMALFGVGAAMVWARKRPGKRRRS